MKVSSVFVLVDACCLGAVVASGGNYSSIFLKLSKLLNFRFHMCTKMKNAPFFAFDFEHYRQQFCVLKLFSKNSYDARSHVVAHRSHRRIATQLPNFQGGREPIFPYGFHVRFVGQWRCCGLAGRRPYCHYGFPCRRKFENKIVLNSKRFKSF